MSNYNKFPSHWREISNEEFAKIFFHYQTPNPEFRQMFHDDETGFRDMKKGYTSAKLFQISDPFHNSEIGIALFEIYIDSRIQKLGFAKYGSEEDWLKFNSTFAYQFRGDNS